jgi:integrase/recombinase XerD
MNLQQLIEQYIAFRQTLGERFTTNAIILRAFGRFVGSAVVVSKVRPGPVAAFLRGDGPITSAWHIRHTALRGFYRYAITRGYVTASPLPTSVPKRPRAFVPYIYSPDELRRLLAAAEATRHPLRRVEPDTLRTLLLTLYGAGLRVSEVRNLARADVDLVGALATIRGSKFGKSRLVPLAPQLVVALKEYAARWQTNHTSGPSPGHFFVGPDGKPLSRPGLGVTFRLARSQAGIRRQDGARYQPRMHDLRHTFAVHRLLQWYRQGADVQKLLPQLSAYLGHRRLCHTQVYLTMIPELLQQAGNRFESYVQKEEDHV